MITQFCVNNDGYIIQDTVPRDEDGNVIEPLHLNPVSYDYDLLESMDRPKYNFTTKLFEDEGIDYDYWINLMNAESDPVLKEEYRMKVYTMIKLISFFMLWGYENELLNKQKIFNDLAKNSLGENSFIYLNVTENSIYKKSFIYPFTETFLKSKQISNINYIGNNEIVCIEQGKEKDLLKINLVTLEETFYEDLYPSYINYIGNNEITYNKNNTFLYKFNLTTLVETQINSQYGAASCYIGNNFLVQHRVGGKLYKINLIDFTETLIYTNTAMAGWTLCYVENNTIVFQEYDYYLYKINLNTLIKTQLINTMGQRPSYCGNGKIIFESLSDGFSYSKYIDDVDNLTQLTNFHTDYPVFIGDIFFNSEYFNNYYNNIKPEINNFIINLEKIKLGTSTELNTFYISTQTLREEYGIYAIENIKEIQGYTENNKIWLEQMNNILGGS
jgi:hypothetical protein